MSTILNQEPIDTLGDSQQVVPPRRRKAAVVAEVMTRRVRATQEDALVCQAAKQVVGTGMRHLVVVNNRGVPTGVFSDRDLLKHLALGGLSTARKKTLSDVWSGQLITICDDATLSEAAGILAGQKIGCLPVVNEDQQLVGILTTGDVLNWVAHHSRESLI